MECCRLSRWSGTDVVYYYMGLPMLKYHHSNPTGVLSPGMRQNPAKCYYEYAGYQGFPLRIRVNRACADGHGIHPRAFFLSTFFFFRGRWEIVDQVYSALKILRRWCPESEKNRENGSGSTLRLLFTVDDTYWGYHNQPTYTCPHIV